MTPSRRLLAALGPLVLFCPPSLAAQAGDDAPAAWTEDVAILGTNVAMGGLTAAVTAWIRGEDPTRAFLRGAAGGGLVFAGKRLVSEDFDGAGFLGREVGAVGSSVVANAGLGRGWLEEVWLPLGPLWIQANWHTPERFRLNVWTLGSLAWALGRPELELDWGETLSNGTFVLRSPRHGLRSDDEPASGITLGGNVLIGRLPASEHEEVRAHELVHVIQQDFVVRAWSRPLESRGWRELLGRDLPIDLAIVPVLLFPPFLSDLMEAEADVLESR
jgi:hypothetical protein